MIDIIIEKIIQAGDKYMGIKRYDVFKILIFYKY